jgi:hypothetical protein
MFYILCVLAGYPTMCFTLLTELRIIDESLSATARKHFSSFLFCFSSFYAESSIFSWDNKIKDALLAPQQSYGKDNYTIDLAGEEATY